MTAPRLTEIDRQVLDVLADLPEDFGFLSFKAIAKRGVPREHVRRVVRKLARKGLTQFAFGLWTDGGEPAGSGYGITEAGRALLAATPTPALTSRGEK